ncbi:hypothetical protein nbrc107696_13440 [Gordonia spumicola]|uniref:Mce/MlaD domain-containing protein n=1 Tax=Gordonia spumicola TaxID=589161 RepID=A0A7I9V699_9ACTN|nr:MlaD family protein [Gordonia spumicola]GEE00898.1 hypothetical protein nbrc107696_13440 [Gordonia spumicola]
MTGLKDRAPTGTLQFLVFLVISAIVIPVGVGFISGPEGVSGTITLRATMTDAFGLTEGTGVTLRGVDIGTVSSSRLGPAGAEIELRVRGDVKIPRDSFMQVTMASMAGIQSVDVIPAAAGGPYLGDGDTIAAPADRQPMQMDQIIGQAAVVMRSIRSGSISTLVGELNAAFGDDDSLAKLVSNGAVLGRLVRSNAPLLRGLLGDFLDVLDAMGDTTSSFETGMKTAASFTDQLDSQQPVFVYLLDHSPAGLRKAQDLFDEYRGTFGGVLANLVTVAPIIANRDDALRTGLQTIPQGLLDLRSIVKNGRADFALIGTQGPVCMYYDEPRRAVGDLTPSNPNLTRYCPPGNGYGQRGAVNAPRPDGLGTADFKDPGKPSGPVAVDDPVLVPDGAELLQQWRELLERSRHGN